MTTYVGIDIGKNGAIVALYPDGTVDKHITPHIGTEIDQHQFAYIIKCINIKANFVGKGVVITIEDVHSIFGAGAKSNFQFGRSLGLVEGILCATELRFEKVTPKTWQKVSFLGVPVMKKPGKREEGRGSNDTKAMALLAAQRLYPDLVLTKSDRAKKAHDGVVDALLIAHYCKLKYNH